MKTLYLASAALLCALSLTACGQQDQASTNTIGPQDSAVGKAMPDTTATPADDALHTAPDAGATGAVPADGSPLPAAPTSNPGESATTPQSLPPAR